MIQEVTTTKGTAAITSDRWHVVHARCTNASGAMSFARAVHSEHENRDQCLAAARDLLRRLGRERRASAVDGAVVEPDEVFARRPGFKTLKVSAQRRINRRAPKERHED